MNKLHRPLLNWFETHGRHDLPWRKEPTPYDVLVSEFMLQQTTVSTIIPRFLAWMKLFPTIQDLAAAEESTVLSAWQGLGYYARARRLHGAAKAIVDRHDGTIPQDKATLMELPGIGPYTASALLAFAFNQPTEVLDTNIIRVVARLNNITEASDTKDGRQKIEAAARAMLPKDNGYAFASAIMDLGSMICTASDPKCTLCPLANLCEAEEPSTLPRKKPKAVITKKKEQRLFYQQDDFIYLEQSSGPLWKGLWILPSTLSPQSHKNHITSITYPITRYRVTMELYFPSEAIPKNLHPFSIEELETIAIPSPHRKAIEKIRKRNNR